MVRPLKYPNGNRSLAAWALAAGGEDDDRVLMGVAVVVVGVDGVDDPWSCFSIHRRFRLCFVASMFLP